MQQMRDNPDCAQEEYDRVLDDADPGITPHLTFDPVENIRFANVKTARAAHSNSA